MPARPHHPPPSAIASFIRPERIDALLAPWVPDAEDRAFVVRCILEEGPAHHRGANYVLLSLLGSVVERLGGVTPDAGPSSSVPLRLPPHLAREDEEGEFPLALPMRSLEWLAPEDPTAVVGMVDCLTDGPPQHSLANAAMVCLLGAILDRLEREGR